LDRVQFDNIYAFAYSPRPGTRAAKLPDDVPNDVKNRRLNEVLQYQMKIAEGRYASRIGKTMEIMVEGEAKNQKMAIAGPLNPNGSNVLNGANVLSGPNEASDSNGGSLSDGGDILKNDEAVVAVPFAPAPGLRVWTGKTSCFRVVNFVSDSPRSLVGKFLSIKITGSTALSLAGELVHDADYAEGLTGKLEDNIEKARDKSLYQLGAGKEPPQ
jgi:tRNA A37 methylthiotransferase MiaB